VFKDLINDKEWRSRITSYEKGSIIFSEGDQGGDLYILISGEIEVLKGGKTINIISEEGAVFGEMASLLENKRTATIRARTHVEVIRIPSQEVGPFLLAHPQTSAVIARNLAARLDETSRIIYGLKEVCDQLPDAVVVTDQECRILVWNSAAEEILGRSWEDVKNIRLFDIFMNRNEAKESFMQFTPGSQPKDLTLQIEHPRRGRRIISSATKPLFDASGTFHGLLSSLRDITVLIEGRQVSRRARKRSAFALILAVLMSVAGISTYIFLKERNAIRSLEAIELQHRMARDYKFLASLLKGPLKQNDMGQVQKILEGFLSAQGKESCPYRSVLILDAEKRVLASAAQGQASKSWVETYQGVVFDRRNSAHSVLTLYRVTPSNPMGEKTVEVVFPLKEGERSSGWVVFEMDMELLKKRYAVTAEGLQAMHFEAAEG
jgi:PAS domain S-box-containing protein